MGLFSSKSKSSSKTTTNYTDNSTNNESAASLGMLSHDNLVVGSGSSYTYTEQGITGDNLKNLLGTVENLNAQTSSIWDSYVSGVQKSAENAMNTTAQAYAESDSELRNIIDAVKPIALYAAIATTFYFIFRGKKW